jgi:hypothetical protein
MAEETAHTIETGAANKIGPGFWILATLLVLYVALCTGNRELFPSADAWEHHRAVKALSEHLWRPGNPTYATPEPSVRYSPYTVILALIARATGIDAYRVLSGAAVFNTAWLFTGVALLLRALRRGRSATAAVIIMIGLYGGAPGYANSYAVADLPWHQVNPSAFAFGSALLAWAIVVRAARRGPRVADGILLVLLVAETLLDHGMTGVTALLGCGVFAWFGVAPERRVLAMKQLAAVTAAAFALALLWPWYSFLAAARSHHDVAYWFNPYILHAMFTQWCAPGVVLALFALTNADQRTARTLLAGSATCLIVGGGAFLIHSALLARVPLPGLVFSHLGLALYADESRLLEVRTWPTRLSALVRGSTAPLARPVMDVVLTIGVLGFLIVQLGSVVREPHLARPLIERLVGRHVERVSIRRRLDRLLTPIGERDVVLSDPLTSWAVPSSRGRVVTPFHYELFTPDQPQRERDAASFFGEATADERQRILDLYGVRWILLERSTLAPAVFSQLLDEAAVVGTDGSLTLMDAKRWQDDRRASR